MPRMRLGRYAEFQRRQRPPCVRASIRINACPPMGGRLLPRRRTEAAEATPAAGSGPGSGRDERGGEPTAYGGRGSAR